MIQLQFLEFRLDDKPAIGILGFVLVIIILMIVLGRIKLGSLGNFSDDWIFEILLGCGF